MTIQPYHLEYPIVAQKVKQFQCFVPWCNERVQPMFMEDQLHNFYLCRDHLCMDSINQVDHLIKQLHTFQSRPPNNLSLNVLFDQYSKPFAPFNDSNTIITIEERMRSVDSIPESFLLIQVDGKNGYDPEIEYHSSYNYFEQGPFRIFVHRTKIVIEYASIIHVYDIEFKRSIAVEIQNRTMDDFKRSLYEQLQLKEGASKTEIEKQVRKLSLECHPDRHPGKEKEEAFKSLQHTKTLLTNEEECKAHFENIEGSENYSCVQLCVIITADFERCVPRLDHLILMEFLIGSNQPRPFKTIGTIEQVVKMLHRNKDQFISLNEIMDRSSADRATTILIRHDHQFGVPIHSIYYDEPSSTYFWSYVHPVQYGYESFYETFGDNLMQNSFDRWNRISLDIVRILLIHFDAFYFDVRDLYFKCTRGRMNVKILNLGLCKSDSMLSQLLFGCHHDDTIQAGFVLLSLKKYLRL
jgi:hypothetical protein